MRRGAFTFAHGALGRLSGMFRHLVTCRVLVAPLPTRVGEWSLPNLNEAELANRVQSLLRCVEPVLVYHREPVEPSCNAAPLWQQAMQYFVPEVEDEEHEQALDRWFGDGQLPAVSTVQRVNDWIHRNKRTIHLIDQGIAKGRFESPRSTASVKWSLGLDELVWLREAAKLKAACCRLNLHRGDLDAALGDAISILRLGQMVSSAECLLVDYLVAHALLGIGLMATYDVAMNPAATQQHARAIVNVLGEIEPDNEAYAGVLRAEFARWLLPALATLSESGDPWSLALLFLAARYELGATLSSDREPEYVRAAGEIAMMIDGHPEPYNQETTVRLASEINRQFLTQLDLPFCERRNSLLCDLRKELAPWPNSVNPHFWAMVESCDELPRSFHRATTRQLLKARKNLRQVANVIGKKLLDDLHSSVGSDTWELFQARKLSVQLRVALASHERVYGVLPKTLDSLVEDEWFREVPCDPYDRQSFRYSREHRLLWSVGRYGANDGLAKLRNGSFAPEEHFSDLIWLVPRHE